ncbi:DNA repair protein RecN [Amylibacter kogurei]|uniref:DNA repair protein RecN n=1 Tax=Paramylibacter kogurei TaxID=1889778 RepID=A0A2G5K694_9RHOB|nr:DNA repair protein RecN [Amylibacter kogurei]PIB24224.1 DNA repair protein RecN [Amylibacter kogurei]
MLRGLNIKDMLLIDRLDLEFQSGLNVLTGETGAGKSILLDSLGFVLGWRGRADLVRTGADQGEVTAVFELATDHPARKILRDAGLPEEDDLILRRTNSRDGRKTAYVNDRRCSGEVLRNLSDTLIELHGQHDDRGLLDPKGHRDLLDTFAGIDLTDLRNAWRERARLQRELDAAKLALETAQADADYLRHAADELTTLAPEVGEDTALDEKRRLMQAGERIREDIAKAANALGPSGAESMLGDATRWLEGASDKANGRLDSAIESLSRAMNELGDAQRGVEDTLAALDFDPMELENCEERLFAIRALARKHNVQPDELPALTDDFANRLRAIDTGADDIVALEKQLAAAASTYDELAQSVHDKRTKAGVELSKSMSVELSPLKLERAVFVVEITNAEPSASGIDTVTFTVATNPGAPAGPINKIASGGELSRFLLALKVCLTKGSTGITMIFDEIDRGVGGATADAVGRRLAGIAQDAQVLVVTHSPQVAAKGAHQWRVSKSVRDGATFSTVEPMLGDARIDEIARMLAGDTITSEARAAARSLLG